MVYDVKERSGKREEYYVESTNVSQESEYVVDIAMDDCGVLVHLNTQLESSPVKGVLRYIAGFLDFVENILLLSDTIYVHYGVVLSM